jgi:serine protease Do
MLAPIESEVTAAVDRLSESVVSLSSYRLASREGRLLGPVEGSGSGIVLDTEGHIVTNHHVIDGASRVLVHLPDGREVDAEVVGSDEATDVALVRVSAGGLKPVPLGDSDHLKVGQVALAVGNSLGLPGGPTVSAGVISALGRPLPGTDYIFEGLIQTDAAINPGNSGGPLANLNGEVVGVNTAMVPFAQGVGFAVPVNTVRRITTEIREHGRVLRPWLGISGVTLTTPVARRYGILAEAGVLVAEVIASGPAAHAGLRPGDVIVGADQRPLKDMKSLLVALSRQPVGSELPLAVLRRGVERRVVLKPALRPEQIPAS